MDALIATFTSPGPELFQHGPFALRRYGLLIAIAVLIGLNLSSQLARQRSLEQGLISDLLPILYANEKQDNYSQSIVLKHKDDTSIIINE
ncbi:MAG: hypothetical protein QF727_04295, partial [Prochlorococcaceae cyanobacterium ETNP14_MAG_4]|nr:hypothetical protein [Prochlorococcaceae cyanobacterium ETNP14_MAG_4]